MSELILKNEFWKIKGAMLEVQKHLGCGFLEKVYQDALEIEFQEQGIPYEREKHITIQYKGKTIDHEYYADFVCYGKIIVELKAVKEIHDVHKAQVFNYLRATDLPLGILVNFGEKYISPERMVNFKSSLLNSDGE